MQIPKEEEEDARPLTRYDENRKELAKHWRCDTMVQGLKHKPWPWRNEELNNLEQDLPRLIESDLEKPSRSYKAKTGVGCGPNLVVGRVPFVDFSRFLACVSRFLHASCWLVLLWQALPFYS